MTPAALLPQEVQKETSHRNVSILLAAARLFTTARFGFDVEKSVFVQNFFRESFSGALVRNYRFASLHYIINRYAFSPRQFCDGALNLFMR
jgi:hypothetical protein